MRRRRALVTLPIVLIGLGGCGASGTRTTGRSNNSPHTTPGDSAAAGVRSGASGNRGYVKGDDDGDEIPKGSYDHDDYIVKAYGHEASTGDLRAVTELVRRYFAAVWAADGATACSLIYRPLARQRNLTSAVPPDYTSPSTAALRDKTCPRFMTALSRLSHEQLAAAGVPEVVVTDLRVTGSHGLAFLGFRIAPEREIAVRRERDAWQIDGLLDGEIP